MSDTHFHVDIPPGYVLLWIAGRMMIKPFKEHTTVFDASSKHVSRARGKQTKGTRTRRSR